MELYLHTFELKLKHTFRVTHGERNTQQTLVVELKQDGISGYGEATPPSYYGITVEEMTKALEAEKKKIHHYHLNKPETFWSAMETYLGHNSFALAALDIAANDLYGKLQHQPLYKLWGYETETHPITNYTIGLDSIEKMVEKIKEFKWPLYKIKLGTKDDIKIIKTLRQHTDAIFRVDANGGWTLKQALKNAEAFKGLNVEFIEQPLPKGEFNKMKELYQESPVPLIADESCAKLGDLEKCAGYFHGINVKLGKCGGLTPAKKMIEKAKELNMKVMGGCMTESTVGVSALAQLLAKFDYIDIDGPLLLANDIAEGVGFDYGKIILPHGNGIGINRKW
jgi:L-Ala-D/L-Glu epimerase